MTPNRRLNILLADDGSEHAQAAVQLLKDLPIPPKTDIRVLRAFAPTQIDWLPEFERALCRSRDQLLAAGFQVQAETRLGSPAELIIQEAEKRRLDLVVVGAKGLRSTVSILLGGVAQHVMEHAACPVLIVRSPYGGIHKVLLATDGSPSSLHTARYLAKFPLPKGTQVHVIHVLPPVPVPIMMEAYAGSWQTLYAPTPPLVEDHVRREREEKLGQTILERTCKAFAAAGIEPVTSLQRGDAATEIMAYARDKHIDLIVAGSHGLRNLASLWVGSVSRKLVHYSDCSVLLVKTPQPKKE